VIVRDCGIQFHFHCATSWLLAVASLAMAPMTRGGEAAIADSAELSATIQLSGDHARLELVGLPTWALDELRDRQLTPREWARLFAVNVAVDGPGNGAQPPSMMGRCEIEGDVVVFTPRFPLRPGLRYRAFFDASRLESKLANAGSNVAAQIELPRRAATSPTAVEAVYPSGDELPANLLKFYIYFSAPMSRGDDYRHVRIVDAEGRAVPDAFLELPEELWDSSGRRLTILFDPGRIKRGLKPHEDVGTPLIAGRTYALVVSPGWRDASGEPLATEFRKEFRVVEADDKQPDPAAWHVAPPRADSQDLLTVVVNEPLDHALLERSLEVVDAAGSAVDGDVAIDEGETRWRFRPATNWRTGDYRIVIDPTLEDRAGNSIGRAFETHDPEAPIGNAVDEPAVIPFVVAP
jgi:hypothetical protein